MARPTEKVELGFDLTGNNTGPYFRLDDATAGVLDNTAWLLGGTVFFDVSAFVKGFTTRRGKSRQLDRFNTGQASVVFDNNARTFDPEYTSSPYYGQIIPRREIRITSGGVVTYFGSIDDWNLFYEPNGDNLSEAVCSDALRILANQTLSAFTNVAQQSGERVSAILSRSEIDWGIDARQIDVGLQRLGADVVDAGTNALGYLQTVEASEPGSLFIGKSGKVTFKDRAVAPTSSVSILSDDSSGISYQGMQVVYGSELLYNDINITTIITGNTSTAVDSLSQGIYGNLTLSEDNLLMESDADALELAQWYSTLYGNPEFRFESVEVILNDLSTDAQTEILDLELGSVVKVIFTPGNPAQSPAITKFAEVIRLDNSVDSQFHKVSIGFSTLETAFFVLNDTEFGRLNTGALGF
tara:strand:- start:768 stop:2003 length:1236 start_codon:yes stop_codon:yes gene_type:complete